MVAIIKNYRIEDDSMSPVIVRRGDEESAPFVIEQGEDSVWLSAGTAAAVADLLAEMLKDDEA
jgi:hypothetical protein